MDPLTNRETLDFLRKQLTRTKMRRHVWRQLAFRAISEEERLTSQITHLRRRVQKEGQE